MRVLGRGCLFLHDCINLQAGAGGGKKSPKVSVTFPLVREQRCHPSGRSSKCLKRILAMLYAMIVRAE